MRNLFNFVIVLVFFLISNSAIAQSLEEIGNSIAQNSNFISLAKNLENYSSRVKNLQEMNRIASMENIGEEDKQKFINALGFNSDEEVYEFNAKNFNNLQNISKTFSLNTLSIEDQNQVLIIAFEDYQAQITGSNCEKRYKRCKATAWAEYGIDAVSCGGIAGALAGPTAGIGGLLVGVGCVTLAAVKLNNSLADCKDDLVDCQGV